MVLNWKKSTLDEKEESFYNDGGKTLEQGVQRDGRCPLFGNIEGQVEWVSGQPDVAEDVPVCGTRVDLDLGLDHR